MAYRDTVPHERDTTLCLFSRYNIKSQDTPPAGAFFLYQLGEGKGAAFTSWVFAFVSLQISLRAQPKSNNVTQRMQQKA